MPLPQITWDDARQLPDDGNRYEAIDGAHYVTPAPSVRHQTVSKRLYVALLRILRARPRQRHAPGRPPFPLRTSARCT